jgi:hypothetical protein
MQRDFFVSFVSFVVNEVLVSQRVGALPTPAAVNRCLAK